jgi:hypothetical protein
VTSDKKSAVSNETFFLVTRHLSLVTV